MNLFAFSSNNLTNIWAGIGAQLWAVSETTDQTIQARKTASKKMPIGSLGILYCKETKAFTTPFIVYSHPSPDKRIDNIWPEPWVLPFKIKTLGTPEKSMPIDTTMSKLPVCVKSGKNNISHVIFIHGQLVFTPTAIEPEDWQIIVDELAI